MRAGRLIELLLLLQVRGRATASELAAALEVSVRTVHRDVEALSAAGVPLYTETGRKGGIRLQPGYRVGGLAHLDEAEARGVLLAAVPGVARDLGLDTTGAEDKLLTAMEERAEVAARSLRDRLLIEPEDWFGGREQVPHLADAARAVWEDRELRIAYRSASAATATVTEQLVRPLGLILKGDTWYLLATPRRGGDRLYRVGRITAATVLDHRFDRPAEFDLPSAWAARKQAFVAAIPRLYVSVRVSPAGERLLHLLQEGTPTLPLPSDVPRDDDGWARLKLRFERPESAARLLLQLGGDVLVLGPATVRDRMRDASVALAALYAPPRTRT